MCNGREKNEQNIPVKVVESSQKVHNREKKKKKKGKEKKDARKV